MATPAAKVETHAAQELRMLNIALNDLNTAKPGAEFWPAQRVLVQSIAAIMESAGTAMPAQEGQRDVRPEKGWFAFNYNGRVFKFREGEFPEYDLFMSAWNVPYDAKSSNGGSSQSGVSVDDKQQHLDALTIEQIKGRAAEAATILASVKY
jgi:hypothetical protein